MHIRSALLVVAAALAGCGGSTGPDVAVYRALGNDLAAGVEDHEVASVTLGAAQCPAERDRYSARVRPMLDRMASMSVDVDACMTDMGQSGSADMQNTCRSMRAELDAHLADACTTGDIAAEAARHASAMDTMIQH